MMKAFWWCARCKGPKEHCEKITKDFAGARVVMAHPLWYLPGWFERGEAEFRAVAEVNAQAGYASADTTEEVRKTFIDYRVGKRVEKRDVGPRPQLQVHIESRTRPFLFGDAQVDDALARFAWPRERQALLEIREQRDLKEQQARAPHRRGPAKPGQDESGRHRLDQEQQARADQYRNGV